MQACHLIEHKISLLVRQPRVPLFLHDREMTVDAPAEVFNEFVTV
jgi:hypothetical protein